MLSTLLGRVNMPLSLHAFLVQILKGETTRPSQANWGKVRHPGVLIMASGNLDQSQAH